MKLFLIFLISGCSSLVLMAAVAGGPNARNHRGAQTDVIAISSLEELDRYASKSGNTLRMEPGKYRLIDYICLETIRKMHESGEWQFIEFRGSDNVFDLTDVEIEVDTELRKELRAPIHNTEFIISGDNNVIRGLTVTNIGDGASVAGNVLSVYGVENTLEEVTLHVQGSFPYGYGDLFDKGGPPKGQPRRPYRTAGKHSGIQITGDHTRLIGCRIYMRAFGHAFFVQRRASHVYFRDCYAEGRMRSTDEMLAETFGPAHEVDFQSFGQTIPPGYMQSLAEDGFRVYDAERLTLINCTARNTRHGFSLRLPGHRLEGCTAIGNEVGFWVGGEAEVLNSRGDARYGPLLFVEGGRGEDSFVELELLPDESPANIHHLAVIWGRGHTVTIRPRDGERRRPLPIKLGYSQPGAGKGMAPYLQRPAREITLKNATNMPVIIGSQAQDCTVRTRGKVLDNAGTNTEVTVLDH